MPAPPDIATLARAIRHAVWYLESGRPDVARDLLRRTWPAARASSAAVPDPSRD